MNTASAPATAAAEVAEVVAPPRRRRTRKAAEPVAAEPVTTFTLDNGLDVVVIEDHRAPVVVQMIWYQVGAADEPAGHSGIAHFLEHLMFKGTETVGPNQFSAIVEAQGGAAAPGRHRPVRRAPVPGR